MTTPHGDVTTPHITMTTPWTHDNPSDTPCGAVRPTAGKSDNPSDVLTLLFGTPLHVSDDPSTPHNDGSPHPQAKFRVHLPLYTHHPTPYPPHFCGRKWGSPVVFSFSSDFILSESLLIMNKTPPPYQDEMPPHPWTLRPLPPSRTTQPNLIQLKRLRIKHPPFRQQDPGPNPELHPPRITPPLHPAPASTCTTLPP
eukprot:366131-Hanusia_phi.AAC.1